MGGKEGGRMLRIEGWKKQKQKGQQLRMEKVWEIVVLFYEHYAKLRGFFPQSMGDGEQSKSLHV